MPVTFNTGGINDSYNIWIVISYGYNPTTHTLFGPYVDLYNSEEEADERLEDFRDKPDWFARKECQTVKLSRRRKIMDKVTLINRLDCIKANCELSIIRKQPMTNVMLSFIIDTIDKMKQCVLEKMPEEQDE